jgi:hypothetical protein
MRATRHPRVGRDGVAMTRDVTTHDKNLHQTSSSPVIIAKPSGRRRAGAARRRPARPAGPFRFLLRFAEKPRRIRVSTKAPSREPRRAPRKSFGSRGGGTRRMNPSRALRSEDKKTTRLPACRLGTRGPHEAAPPGDACRARRQVEPRRSPLEHIPDSLPAIPIRGSVSKYLLLSSCYTILAARKQPVESARKRLRTGSSPYRRRARIRSRHPGGLPPITLLAVMVQLVMYLLNHHSGGGCA